MMPHSFEHALDLVQKGEISAAEPVLQALLRGNPRHFDALHLLGVCRFQAGDANASEMHLRRALALRPGDAAALANLGNALRMRGLAMEALECFSRACALAPGLLPARLNRGRLLVEMGRAHEALPELERVLAQEAAHPQAWRWHGLALGQLGRLDEAFASLRRHLQRRADDAQAWNEAGALCNALRRYEEAEGSFARAIALAPGLDLAHANRGNALFRLGRFEEARAAYREALRLAPENAVSRWNLSHVRLLLGEYEEGFRDYESRWQQVHSENFAPREFFDRPRWQGEEIPGRTILLHAEQGLGDTILACRYLARVVPRVGRVLLEVPAPLVRLLARCLEGPVEVLARGAPLPSFDVHCPLLSLPLVFGTTLSTVPSDIPYLHPDPVREEAWRRELGPATRPRVGLAWSGGTDQRFDDERSIPLEEFHALAGEGVDFLAVQKELRARDAAALRQFPALRWFGDSLHDFEDTAALLSCCDLVVSVDTAVAHLAGALARPLWLVVPFAPDWRWGARGKRSAWYPQARILRPPARIAWKPVIAQIAQALHARDLDGIGGIAPASCRN